MKETASGRLPEPGAEGEGAPTKAKRADGQYVDHWVLSAEERASGFVRPVRRSYKHVGSPGPRFPLRDLTPREQERHGAEFAKIEDYPESERPLVSRAWSAADLARVGHGCGGTTTMPQTITETYAAQPRLYGRTFCATCRDYFPVGVDGEFVWVGTLERVGS